MLIFDKKYNHHLSMRHGLDQASQMVSKGSNTHCKEERKDDTRRPVSIDATDYQQPPNHEHMPGHPAYRIILDPDAMTP